MAFRNNLKNQQIKSKDNGARNWFFMNYNFFSDEEHYATPVGPIINNTERSTKNKLGSKSKAT